jgi:hypothetical protein
MSEKLACDMALPGKRVKNVGSVTSMFNLMLCSYSKTGPKFVQHQPPSSRGENVFKRVSDMHLTRIRYCTVH